MPWPDDEYVSDWAIAFPRQPRDAERSEQPIMSDGQLGSDVLAAGPERINPEGSVDISNRRYNEPAPERMLTGPL